MAHKAPEELLNKLKESKSYFEELTTQLSDPEIISNREKFTKLSKERNHLDGIMEVYELYLKKLESYLGSLEMMVEEKDAELKEMASQEVKGLEPWLNEKLEELKILLLPKDPNDEKNVMLEIRAGVGGDEAGLFVQDMYRAYTRYAEKNRWQVELMSLSENSSGGLKEVIATISGERVYSLLKYESGVHRVQRVPKTETQGRVHTSTITVAILPEAEEIDLQIDTKDLRIDVMRAGGSGGQHVNTTDSAVRITHIPTNEVVICQDEKSQLKNKNKAMKVLRTRLYERLQKEKSAKEAAARKSQVGTGFRNERIRTYNFPQGRVSDHRINLTTYNLDAVMEGDIEAYLTALSRHYQLEALKGSGS